MRCPVQRTLLVSLHNRLLWIPVEQVSWVRLPSDRLSGPRFHSDQVQVVQSTEGCRAWISGKCCLHIVCYVVALTVFRPSAAGVTMADGLQLAPPATCFSSTWRCKCQCCSEAQEQELDLIARGVKAWAAPARFRSCDIGTRSVELSISQSTFILNKER